VGGVLHVTQALAHVSLLGEEALLDGSWESVQGNNDVLGVADLLELDVGDLLVVDVCGVVCGNVTWEFGEVGSHVIVWMLKM
jgi:hypothetical protein